MGKFAWFLLGLILGAAVTLAAVTLTGRVPGIGPEDEDPQAVTRIPAAPSPAAVQRSLEPAPVPPEVVPRSRAMEPASAPAVDNADQVAEDAAAAGMTSRSRRNEPAPAPGAQDELPPYP
jgi:hypothetical protein